MTARELMTLACALTGESPQDDPDTEAYAGRWITLLLTRLLPAENLLRERDGLPPLAAAPWIETPGGAEIPYRDELTRGVLPYGLAAVMAGLNGENETERSLRAEYGRALRDAVPVRVGSIVRVN